MWICSLVKEVLWGHEKRNFLLSLIISKAFQLSSLRMLHCVTCRNDYHQSPERMLVSLWYRPSYGAQREGLKLR